MKKLLVVGLVAALAAAGVGVAIGVGRLRPAVAQQLSAALQSPVTVGSVAWVPVFGVQVRDVTAPNPPGFADRPWLRVAGVTVRVAPWSLVRRRPVVFDLVMAAPDLFVERQVDGRLNVPMPAAASGGPAVVPTSVRVTQGAVTVRDHRSSGDVALRVDDLQARVRLTVPAAQVQGEVSGVIRAPDGQAVGTIRGEATLASDRTGHGTVALTHQAVQHLAPYVQEAIGASPTAGTITIRASFTARGDEVTIPVQVEAQGLVFAPEAMTVLGVPAQQLVQLLQDETGRIQVQTEIRGRWDQLQVSWDALLASAVQQALRHAMARQLQQVIQQQLPVLLAPPADGQEPTSLEDRLKALGKELKRSLKESVTPPADSSGTP